MKNQWFRLYGFDYLSDPKIRSLTADERSCWITLLCYASTTSIPGEVRMTEKQLMIDSGVDPMGDGWNKTVGILQKFEDLEMIEIDLVTIRVKNWNKRQFVKLTGYDRIKRHRIRSKTREQDDRKIQEWFDAFWEAYPRKIAKVKAQKSWNQTDLTQEIFDKIILSIEQQKKTEAWKNDGGKFIPHPATWLNQERWNDEIFNRKVGGGKFENVRVIKT